jgi:UDP-GlcNAc:undecaprenyl-phosphate GlcNAc-1-phosphate transferase
MIWLSVVAFLVTAIAAGCVVRWARGHAARYGESKPQRFHLGNVPRLGGLALLMGLVVSWCAGMLQTAWGDVSSLRMGPWVGFWLLALLPAVVGGMVEDVTQRLTVRYRLLLTGLTAALAVGLLGLSVPRLGLSWLDAGLQAAPWLGMALAVLAIAGLPHAFNIIDGYNGLAGMVLPWVFWSGTTRAACFSQGMAEPMSGASSLPWPALRWCSAIL